MEARGTALCEDGQAVPAALRGWMTWRNWRSSLFIWQQRSDLGMDPWTASWAHFLNFSVCRCCASYSFVQIQNSWRISCSALQAHLSNDPRCPTSTPTRRSSAGWLVSSLPWHPDSNLSCYLCFDVFTVNFQVLILNCYSGPSRLFPFSWKTISVRMFADPYMAQDCLRAQFQRMILILIHFLIWEVPLARWKN